MVLEITETAGIKMLPYYLFAAFVFVLICLVIVLWRFLFGQGIKKDRMYLERKEEEIKQMLISLRKEADDFFDLAASKSAEISDERKRVASMLAGFVFPQASEFARPPEPAAPEVKTVQISEFRRAIDEASRKQIEASKPPVEPPQPTDTTVETPEVKPPSKREQIAELLDSGKDAVQIAKELGVTRNEVDLVIRTR